MKKIKPSKHNNDNEDIRVSLTIDKVINNKKLWIGILIALIILELVITVIYTNKCFVKLRT